LALYNINVVNVIEHILTNNVMNSILKTTTVVTRITLNVIMKIVEVDLNP